jgi:uncharacterized protein YdhG (YjbR/CyaY superfamily)
MADAPGKVIAPEVDAYLADAPAERRAVLGQLRELCLEELPGFEERLDYGMPSYLRDGTVEVAFASQARTINVYVLRTDVMAAHANALANLDTGKGAIRFPPDAVPLNLVRSILGATAASTGPVC